MNSLTISIKNNQRKISRISALLAFIMVVVFILTLQNNSFQIGRWALTLISIFLSVALLVTSFVFRNRAKKMDKLLSGEKSIARWELSPDQRTDISTIGIILFLALKRLRVCMNHFPASS